MSVYFTIQDEFIFKCTHGAASAICEGLEIVIQENPICRKKTCVENLFEQFDWLRWADIDHIDFDEIFITQRDFDVCYDLLSKAIDKAAAIYKWTESDIKYYSQILTKTLPFRDSMPLE